MRYDTVIIGGGLSGLMSGIALARAGQQVAIISAGQSALHFSSGSFELYGGTESPLEGIATLPEEHPYRKLGLERVARYAEQTKELLSEAGIQTKGSAERNHYRLTPIGMVKPAWLSLADYTPFQESDSLPWKRVLIANLEGYLDFFPSFVAAGLMRLGTTSRVETISLPQLEHLRKSTTEMRATNIARVLEGEVLQALAQALNDRLGDAEAVLMPAVVGLKSDKLMLELRQLVSVPICFLPTMPASVPGVRTQLALCNYFQQLGGTYLLGDNVTEGRLEGDRLVSVKTHNHEEVEFKADHFILATGSFFSHGLIAETNRITEPIFGLDVEADEQRTQWYAKDLYARQPYMSYGVRSDERFRPMIQGRPIENLYATGSILAGQRALEEGTGGGVATTTALYVADLILNR